MNTHRPVMLEEVIKILNPHPHQFFIDGTLNGGGHARAILNRIVPDGKFLGVDLDKKAIDEFIRENLGNKSTVIENNNYKNIPEILKEKELGKADGVLLDLGFSSNQIENSGRGFSFEDLRANEPLLMTYSDSFKPLHQILNEIKENDLAKVIKNYGDERWAEKIAKAIKKNLPIMTSGKLASVIKNVLPKNYEKGRIHPATRTFQALRIFANHELENLETFLENISKMIYSGGRVAIISFHSLEDRLVKRCFAKLVKEKAATLLVKKPLVPNNLEIQINPRSRSAKLRAIQLV